MKEPIKGRNLFKKNIQRRLGPDHVLDEDTDLLIYLDFILFVKRLARASQEQVENRQELGKKKPTKLRISGEDIEKVSEKVLREFRG